MFRRAFLIASIIVLALAARPTFAASTPPAQAAETIRATLVQAQLQIAQAPDDARAQLATSAELYRSALAAPLAAGAADADQAVRQGFSSAEQAIADGNTAAFAAARAQIWTALLRGGYLMVGQALQRGDGQAARSWLLLREFRHATRFSRPNADATMAISSFAAGKLTAEQARATLNADVLDTYQARLTETLGDLSDSQTQSFASRRAELAGMAEGYFTILAPAYAEQRGASERDATSATFASLREAALSGAPLAEPLAQAQSSIKSFRAAPLSADEQSRRAGQMLRFLDLVPVEYERGVNGGRVITDLEIREASTFRDGAAAAFNDLRTIFDQTNPTTSEQAAQLFDTIEKQLKSATPDSAPEPDSVQANIEQLSKLLETLMPAAWKQRDNSADFDVIRTALDQMEQAIKAGQYDLAESARLEAYAIMESGPEAKLTVFAPQHKTILEDLFWYGQGDHIGLASLIERHASASEIKASRVALDNELTEAEKALAGNNAPAAIASNAAIIVFREGLEAVIILASLMGSLKMGQQRRFRKPLWLGAGLALLGSVLTWMLAHEVLTALARYGEKLEAVVSLIAIAVLLLITNWFFHDVYWKGWMSNFHQQKKRIIGGVAGQMLGLMILGFTSIYREGFETVLFLQALVLESGTATVLSGVAIGLAATVLVGLLVFVVQTKLPHKKMLIFTGILIGAVLLQMVGNTVHVLQVVGWLPTHPIRWLTPLLPYWAGLWVGLYATWEGILLQFAAGGFTIGSYFLAEFLNKREQRIVMEQGVPTT